MRSPSEAVKKSAHRRNRLSHRWLSALFAAWDRQFCLSARVVARFFHSFSVPAAMACAVLLGAVLTGGPLLAQSTFGTILGAVTDPNGALMPGAQVTLTHQETNITRQGATNEAGLYEFPNLVPGTYRLELRREGFKTFVKADIALGARQAVRVDAAMELGALTETVTVTFTPGLVETEVSSISGTVAGGEVHFLSPTTENQRPWTLMRLNPLVQNTNSGTRYSMGGAYYNQAEFQIDGISAPLGAGGPAGSSVMSSEALQEVKILAVNNSAEYASPGVFQQISKGGGNAVRGDVYYYYNTPGLNAREATAIIKPSRLYHMFGGNISGPIRVPKLYHGRDRTFFSLSWQSKRERGSQNYLANVPTLDMRNGVLAASIRNPFTGQPFPNNTVPASLISPVSKFFQDTYYPLPNAGTPTSVSNNHQIGGPTGTSREEVLDLRVDHKLSDRHWLYSRVGGTQFDNRQYESSLPTMGFRATTRKLWTGVVSYNFNIRADLLNEFRAGFSRDNNPGGGPNNGLEVLRRAGIQFPAALPAPDTRGFPVINITGVQLLSQGGTTKNISASYQMTDTMSWIRERHTFKGGINIFWEQPNYVTIASGVHGNFQFQGVYSTQAYADFLLGIPSRTSVVGINPARYMRSTNYGLFFQDDFKARPDLTLNLGLRWDYQGPIYNKNNGLYNLDPATGGLIKAAPNTPVNSTFAATYTKVPVLEASAVGLPERTLHFADKNNFTPRIGFAWRPRNSSTFVVRGAWGKFTDILGEGLYEQLAQDGFLSRGNLVWDNLRLDSRTNVIPDSAFRFPNPFPVLTQAEAPTGLTARGFNPRLFNPYVQQWNLSLEKALWQATFRASYVGTKSTNLIYTRDINQRRNPNSDASRPYYANGFSSSISYLENGGSQVYHGLQLEARKRLEKGLMFQAGYVFSKNISDVLDQDDNDAKATSTDANNRALDRGVVGYHRRHNFTASAIWELPLGRGRRLLGSLPTRGDRLVSGWTLDAELFSGSGQWFSPCRVGSNPLTAMTCASQTARPDRVGNGNDGPRQTGSSQVRWFNTEAFREPARDALGNAGRNILVGPGFWHTSVSLTKKVRFLESKELWLSVAAMNVFNHPNFRSPGANTGELTVGQAAFGSTSSLLNTDRAADRAKARAIWLRVRIMF